MLSLYLTNLIFFFSELQDRNTFIPELIKYANKKNTWQFFFVYKVSINCSIKKKNLTMTDWHDDE